MGVSHNPPEGLGDAGLGLWNSITATFNFTDEPGKLALLERAARVADQIDKLEREVAVVPMTAKGSMGQLVIHPFIAEVRAQTTVLNSLLKSLGLPETDEEKVARSERRSRAGRAGANARWGVK
ncbi:hypothetical protein [uncultured Corynebacterium sp.]|uniref:hypothetical protein n=1 Tax=uncultured Corynebacterium sp. TaxID=159447 RepID=UPI0025F97D51|nr:hypothetical protein [uncultured Corynebacterium sp.]